MEGGGARGASTQRVNNEWRLSVVPTVMEGTRLPGCTATGLSLYCLHYSQSILTTSEDQTKRRFINNNSFNMYLKGVF